MSDFRYLAPPPGGLQLASITGAGDPTLIAAADRASRHWTSTEPGPLPPGSEAHKRAVCRMFHETFNPYKPSVIDWPKLDPEARDRLVTSCRSGTSPCRPRARRGCACCPMPRLCAIRALSAAIGLNGWEEGRHKEVLSNLVQTYGIALAPEPPYLEPRDPEWAYLVTGFSECIDSFFAFGLFELARRSGYFPPELVDTFEPVIQEEARHILLFANWLAWHRRNIPWWRRVGFEAAGLARCGCSWRGSASASPAAWTSGDKAAPQDNNFTVTGAKSVSSAEVSAGALMAICLAENDRRFAGYDARLVRPTTTPRAGALRAAVHALAQGGASRRGSRSMWHPRLNPGPLRNLDFSQPDETAEEVGFS